MAYRNMKTAGSVLRSMRQGGLTMVELLVAMALGLFLTWGAVQAFLSGKQGYSMQQALSRIQENARMAQELIGYDIRDAGNYGCAVGRFVANAAEVGAEAVNRLPTANNVEFDFQNVVFAANDVSGSATGDMLLATPLNPAPLAGTDILVVHTATNLGAEVRGTPAADIPTTNQITVPNRGFTTADILSVSNCSTQTIFTPASVVVAANTKINYPFGALSIPLAGSSVMRLNTVIYYIALNPNNNPALYRRLLNNNSEELLEGVENMQLMIGVDTNLNDGQADVYLNPGAVTAAQWSAWNDAVAPTGVLDGGEQNVVAVRYSLLLRGEDRVLEAPQTYTYNGAVVTAALDDFRLRQVVTSTVGIRSRMN